MSELGLDAQKSDIRPVLMGNAAMDADARSSHAINIGRSGEAQRDHGGFDAKRRLCGAAPRDSARWSFVSAAGELDA